MDQEVRKALSRGLVIPAHPLALDDGGRLDERHQRALTRYYVAAGAGGLAVGVHTTQFEIRDPRHGLLEPVLALAREEMDRADGERTVPLVRVGGICGRTEQAVREAALLHELGYHAGLISLSALRDASGDELIEHCARVAEIIPLVGFYLQPAVGGRPLAYEFWRRFAGIERVVAIKIAPFNRYQTLDVIRGVVEAGRDDIALYTGNDDNIVADLVTPYRFSSAGHALERRIVGGLLGHWSVWTRRAVDLLEDCHAAVATGAVTPALLHKAVEVTDCNAALFDAAHGFAGCIAGIQHVLKEQGLIVSTRTLAGESLSPGQAAEIDRVRHAYPHLVDDQFVSENLATWLRP